MAAELNTDVRGHVLASACTLLFWSMVAGAWQDPPKLVRSWLPMQVGDRWTYEVEIRTGSRKHPNVARWEQRATTAAIRVIPQGLLMERRVEVLSTRTLPGTGKRSSDSDLLVRGDCIYFVDDSQFYGLHPAASGLSGKFLEDLVRGALLPDICLPLETGRTWGNTRDGRAFWKVAGLGRKNPDDPNSATPGSWRIEGHLASGDDNYMWFEKGIGLTAARVFHNGTFNDYRIRLLRFQPGTRR